jgi:hypothetical protein
VDAAVGMALMALSSLVIVASLRAYFAKSISNAFSGRDYRQVLWHAAGLSFFLLGILSGVGFLGTSRSILYTVLSCGGASVFLAELLRQFRSYRSPGVIGYQPHLIRYWPSWVFRENTMAVDCAAIIKFALVESFFDLNFVVLSDVDGKLVPEGRNETRALRDVPEAAVKRLLEQRLSYSIQGRISEEVLVESGSLRQNDTVVIVCEAPGFEPSRCEVKSNIGLLQMEAIPFVLVPKSAGSKVIVFKIHDADGLLRANMTVQCRVRQVRNRLLGIAGKAAKVATLVLGIAASALSIVKNLMDVFKP